MSNKRCWPFFHKFKLLRAGALGSQFQCSRCGQIRNEPAQ